MNIRQIEAFRAVMETGSVTRAAEQLYVSQPAVSKLLRALSDRCGFPLFVRRGSGLVPTPEARLMAVEVERTFSGIERIAEVAQALRESRWGQVTIAAFPALAMRFLPGALSPFLAERPDVRLSLFSRTSPRVGDLTANQQVDIGLSLLPVEHPYVRSEVVARFALVCAVPAGHPLTAKAVVQAEDLRDERFISLGREDRSRFVVDAAFRGRVPQNIQIEAQMAESACAFVASGLGVAIVPPFATREYAEDRLIARPFEPRVMMDIWLHVPVSREPSMLTLEIAGLLRSSLAPFDARAEVH
jgi:DNA-binding transcriptional LysR family regulator